RNTEETEPSKLKRSGGKRRLLRSRTSSTCTSSLFSQIFRVLGQMLVNLCERRGIPVTEQDRHGESIDAFRKSMSSPGMPKRVEAVFRRMLLGKFQEGLASLRGGGPFLRPLRH